MNNQVKRRHSRRAAGVSGLGFATPLTYTAIINYL